MKGMSRERKYSRGQLMVYEAVVNDGATPWGAAEQVAAWAAAHPKVNMDEELTWEQWRLEQVTRQ